MPLEAGGFALLSSSRLVITDIWVGLAPSIVTAFFATGYVSNLGIGMAAGRFGWSIMSDIQNTHAICGFGTPVVGLVPYLRHAAATMSMGDSLALSESTTLNSDNILPLLTVFYGGVVLAITFCGGIFSTPPTLPICLDRNTLERYMASC